MTSLSRRVARVDMVRASALSMGALMVLVLAAYAFAAITSSPTAGPLVAALALLAVAGSGLLYAWRLGTGGLSD